MEREESGCGGPSTALCSSSNTLENSWARDNSSRGKPTAVNKTFRWAQGPLRTCALQLCVLTTRYWGCGWDKDSRRDPRTGRARTQWVSGSQL